MVESIRMRWFWHAANVEKRRDTYIVWWGNLRKEATWMT
jgi:hypothetical protein